MARQKGKIVGVALADSLGPGISSRDRKLWRQKSGGNPGASLKHALGASLSIIAEAAQRYSTVYAGGGSEEICGFSEGTSPFIPVQYSSLPEVPVLQAQSCPGEGEGEGTLVRLGTRHQGK